MCVRICIDCLPVRLIFPLVMLLKCTFLSQKWALNPICAAAFRFVELFAGIGGFRLALEALGGQCVFSSELEPGTAIPISASSLR